MKILILRIGDNHRGHGRTNYLRRTILPVLIRTRREAEPQQPPSEPKVRDTFRCLAGYFFVRVCRIQEI